MHRFIIIIITNHFYSISNLSSFEYDPNEQTDLKSNTGSNWLIAFPHNNDLITHIRFQTRVSAAVHASLNTIHKFLTYIYI